MKTVSTFAMMRPRSRRSQAAFTLIELLVVMAIIGVLAGLLVGLAPVAGTKIRESRVRAELASLTTAIEAYKSKHGFYPPDGLDPTGRVDPRINPLYYELVGTQVLNPKDPVNGRFQAPDGENTLTSPEVNAMIGRDGFANAGQDRRRLFTTSFRASQHATLRSYPDGAAKFEILVAGAPWPQNRPDQPIKNITRGGRTFNQTGLNPWRYVSSNPTNNPTSYDLWAEIPFSDRNLPNRLGVRIIGNWKNR